MDSIIDNKTVRRRRSDCAWRKGSVSSPTIKQEELLEEYPAGPIKIIPSWNPVNKADKPPYSYATIIGHAILTSSERKLTLNDIYVWITENYPYYSNDTQGWQNSIRHNLSLHKSFVKIDRDLTAQNPPRKGCFWTIRPGKEKFFIDTLQRPLNQVRKQHSLSHIVSVSRKSSISRRYSSSLLSESSPKTSPSSIKRLNHSLRATEEIPSSTHSESGSIVVSSSDHISSPSPSLSGSPNYDELLSNVPETSISYNVYPENTTELFGEQYQIYSHFHSTNHSVYSYPPSLSPCDGYSTVSSVTDHHQPVTYKSSDVYSDLYPTGLTSTFYNNQLNSPSFYNDVKQEEYWSPIKKNQKDTFLQPAFHYTINKHQDYHEKPELPSSYFIKEESMDNFIN